MRNGKYYDAKIAEMIQVINAMSNEYKYARNIVGSGFNDIDFNTRNSFYAGIPLLIIKCIAKFNHYNIRNQMINKGLLSSEYPQYFEREDWGHIIQCKAISQDKRELIKRLHRKIMKAKTNVDTEQEILAMLNDIVQYLQGTDDKY